MNLFWFRYPGGGYIVTSWHIGLLCSCGSCGYVWTQPDEVGAVYLLIFFATSSYKALLLHNVSKFRSVPQCHDNARTPGRATEWLLSGSTLWRRERSVEKWGLPIVMTMLQKFKLIIVTNQKNKNSRLSFQNWTTSTLAEWHLFTRMRSMW